MVRGREPGVHGHIGGASDLPVLSGVHSGTGDYMGISPMKEQSSFIRAASDRIPGFIHVAWNNKVLGSPVLINDTIRAFLPERLISRCAIDAEPLP